MASCLKPGGALVVLVPQGKGLYGTLDRGMGTKRRFDAADLAAMLAKMGFRIEQEHQINKIGAAGWWFSSRVLHRSRISRPALKLWDKSVWLLRQDRRDSAVARALAGGGGPVHWKMNAQKDTTRSLWLPGARGLSDRRLVRTLLPHGSVSVIDNLIDRS